MSGLSDSPLTGPDTLILNVVVTGWTEEDPRQVSATLDHNTGPGGSREVKTKKMVKMFQCDLRYQKKVCRYT